MTLEELQKVTFERQLDAMVRTIALVGDVRSLTIDDITAALMEAERVAQFVCGFKELHADDDIKKKLRDYLLRLARSEVGACSHFLRAKT